MSSIIARIETVVSKAHVYFRVRNIDISIQKSAISILYCHFGIHNIDRWTSILTIEYISSILLKFFLTNNHRRTQQIQFAIFKKAKRAARRIDFIVSSHNDFIQSEMSTILDTQNSFPSVLNSINIYCAISNRNVFIAYNFIITFSQLQGISA